MNNLLITNSYLNREDKYRAGGQVHQKSFIENDHFHKKNKALKSFDGLKLFIFLVQGQWKAVEELNSTVDSLSITMVATCEVPSACFVV